MQEGTLHCMSDSLTCVHLQQRDYIALPAAVAAPLKTAGHGLGLLRAGLHPDAVCAWCCCHCWFKVTAVHAQPQRIGIFLHDQPGITGLCVQVWSENEYTGVVGVFHLQGAFWDRETRRFNLGRAPLEPLWARVRDTDVPTLPAVAERLQAGGCNSTQRTAIYRHLTDEVLVVDEADHTACVRVNPADADVLTLAPIVRSAAGVEHAVLGLANMLNCGGAIEDIRYVGAVLTVDLRGEGSLLMYCTQKPNRVEVDGVLLSDGDDHGWRFERDTVRVDVAASTLSSGVDHAVRIEF